MPEARKPAEGPKARKRWRIQDYVCEDCGASGWRAWVAHCRFYSFP